MEATTLDTIIRNRLGDRNDESKSVMDIIDEILKENEDLRYKVQHNITCQKVHRPHPLNPTQTIFGEEETF